MVTGRSGLHLGHATSLVVEVFSSDSGLVTTRNLNMGAMIVRVMNWTAGLVIPIIAQVRNTTLSGSF